MVCQQLPQALIVKSFEDKVVKLPPTPCIYLIYCKQNHKIYIGSALSARNRFYKHCLSLKNNKHHSIYLQRAFNKYGINAFEFRVMQYVDSHDLIAVEQKFIDQYLPEYNICKTAGNRLGIKCPEHVKNRLRQVNLGKKMTPANKAIAIKNLKPYFTTGHKHSEETKQKMSATRKQNPPMGMKGKHHSVESRHKISNGSTFIKTYNFLSPEGKQIQIENLSKFCKQHGLIRFHMYAVNSGNRISHRGWRSSTSPRLTSS